jgi:SAM-dependent methyltransferase
VSKSICVVPWSTFVVGPDGRGFYCCDSPHVLSVDGRQGSVYTESFEDLWNGEDLAGIRAEMAAGGKPSSCDVCWQREAEGGVSRRLLVNSTHPAFDGALRADRLPALGADTGYRLERRPVLLTLEMGNLCALKCRSCSPLFSSAVAADAVQSAWVNGLAPGASLAQGRLRLVPSGSRPWYEDTDAVARTIASGLQENGHLQLLGGEPFLIDAIWRLLEALVRNGVAARIGVGLVTSGQYRRPELVDMAPRFRGFQLALSIDGCGDLYEYLRHGARWDTLVANVRWFRETARVHITATPTLQNGNALDFVPLLRFFKSNGMAVGYNVLTWPARLQPTNLPPRVRAIAAARLRSYLDLECPAQDLAAVNGYVEALESAGDGFDAGRFGEFMAFTNDLDAARGESLARAAPELWDLIRAAGVDWSAERRHRKPSQPESPAVAAWSERLRAPLNRSVAAHDVIYPGFESVQRSAYYDSGPRQLATIDARLREHGCDGLDAARAVADYACHYGRLTRALRAALPHAAVYACDIDAAAVEFCATELGALPWLAGWRPDVEPLPGDLDAVFCLSLLTHTPLQHWSAALRAWHRMLKPGGVVAFTYLGADLVASWEAGALAHYGTYSAPARAAALASWRETGFGFAPIGPAYGEESMYGVAFARADVVRRELAAAGLEPLAIDEEATPHFAQNLVLARKPATTPAREGRRAERAEVRRDVSVLALFDPCGYAPENAAEGSSEDSGWARIAGRQGTPLPTEIGFGDARVAEVREAQAALAAEHGIDAFCWIQPWSPAGARWSAPLRELVASGRPSGPFCVAASFEHDEDAGRIAPTDAVRLIDDLAPALGDRRYQRVDERPLLVLRGLERLESPREAAAAWRDRAAALGLGEIFLCALETTAREAPAEFGVDAIVENPPSGPIAAAVPQALTRPWPRHRLFRTVRCQRDPADLRALEWYEHWLRGAIDATRRRGEPLLFVASWNGWTAQEYLEPDDHDGRAALLATRRAVRGPSSGLVLLRRLRDALGHLDGEAENALTELGAVLDLHEHTRDQLLATIDVALGRPQDERTAVSSGSSRWVPLSSRLLPASGAHHHIDRVGGISGPALDAAEEPVPVDGPSVLVAGWAHAGTGAVDQTELFVVLEGETRERDRVYAVTERQARPDVVAALPDYPEGCGFVATLDLSELRPGIYRLALVQGTADAAYRDLTPVRVIRHKA